MNETSTPHASESIDKEFRKFAWSRYIAGILIAIVLLWGAGYVLKKLIPAGDSVERVPVSTGEETSVHPGIPAIPEAGPTVSAGKAETEKEAIQPGKSSTHAPSHGKSTEPVRLAGPPGVAFVESVIAPIDYELQERFWGWRPNDIINITDNVNELQVGVLEVTRRATVILTDRLSRRGSAEAIDPSLERAMNGLMIKAESYWFPAPENKYKEAISELRIYHEKLKKGHANFYTRTDNLIPLLRSFEELLGSCDDNLVKQFEEDGDHVSTFHADNYYYYAKGVAIAMYSILGAVEQDFQKTLEVRGGTDILHHAVEACHEASVLRPWLFVTEANLNGIWANHRANMAAPISHARFYIDLLIETLST